MEGGLCGCGCGVAFICHISPTHPWRIEIPVQYQYWTSTPDRLSTEWPLTARLPIPTRCPCARAWWGDPQVTPWLVITDMQAAIAWHSSCYLYRVYNVMSNSSLSSEITAVKRVWNTRRDPGTSYAKSSFNKWRLRVNIMDMKPFHSGFKSVNLAKTISRRSYKHHSANIYAALCAFYTSASCLNLLLSSMRLYFCWYSVFGPWQNSWHNEPIAFKQIFQLGGINGTVFLCNAWIGVLICNASIQRKSALVEKSSHFQTSWDQTIFNYCHNCYGYRCGVVCCYFTAPGILFWFFFIR